MRFLVDTNVVLDILLKRELFFEASYGVLKYAIEQGFECMVSASAITDIYYVLKRSFKDETRAKQALEHLLQLLNVADVLGIDIQTALSSNIPDFEDAVQHAVAVRNGANLILTRNVKDYCNASIEIICPSDFLNRLDK